MSRQPVRELVGVKIFVEWFGAWWPARIRKWQRRLETVAGEVALSAPILIKWTGSRRPAVKLQKRLQRNYQKVRVRHE